eukprot:TRINITY_DN6245_c0_g2_i1.p1 TRINITY_DN6245_c0_g2~~TRINITY_DN6245_c0_g2_i1.p1  ORF type:complete len:452 (+),score=95.99 TRINITY_DN6245_c0_g2_i1:117-1472(+)
MVPTTTSHSIDLQQQEDLQPSLNIGAIGHVAHGKSTLVRIISGKKTQQHSQELQKDMTIKLGYANAKIWKCPLCPGDSSYHSTGSDKFIGQVSCETCGSTLDLVKHISFVDCPGHEVLMQTMLNGAAVMDAAILVIAANQPCPSPQTAEHLSAVELMGLRNILVVQNKVDLIPYQKSLESYGEIVQFTKNTILKDAPVVPISAQQGWNVDSLCRYITQLPVPDRNISADPLMAVIRSFDVNKPGEDDILNLQGAVVGGSLLQGHLKVGQVVEMRPGLLTTTKPGVFQMRPIRMTITSIFSEKNKLDVALTGGLVALGTTLDPSLGRADKLVGQVIGIPGKMPGVFQKVIVSYTLIDRVVETEDEDDFYGKKKGSFLKKNEEIKVSVGSNTTTATIKGTKADLLRLFLKYPCCADMKDRVAISAKNSGGRWSLVGVGMIIKGWPLMEVSEAS